MWRSRPRCGPARSQRRLATPMPCSALMLPPASATRLSTASSTRSSSGASPVTFRCRFPSPTCPNTQRWAAPARAADGRPGLGHDVVEHVEGQGDVVLVGRALAVDRRVVLLAHPPQGRAAGGVGGQGRAPEPTHAGQVPGQPLARADRPRHLEEQGDRRLRVKDRGQREVVPHEGDPVGQDDLGRLQIGKVATGLRGHGHGGREVVEPDQGHRGLVGGWDQGQAELGDHSQRPFGAAEQRGQVVARVVLHQPPEVADHCTRAQHGLDPQKVASGHAVGQDVVASGVGGHRPPDGRGVPGAEVDRVAPARGRRRPAGPHPACGPPRP